MQKLAQLPRWREYRWVSDSTEAKAWWMPFLLLVATVVAVPLLILDEQGLPRYRALNSEVGDVRERNDELRQQIDQLQAEVTALKTDPNVIERIARDEMSMVRPGEIVFQFAD